MAFAWSDRVTFFPVSMQRDMALKHSRGSSSTSLFQIYSSVAPMSEVSTLRKFACPNWTEFRANSQPRSFYAVLWNSVCTRYELLPKASFSHMLYSGAAAEASRLGISAIAFSGVSGAHVSYTTLSSSPDDTSTHAARTYASLTVHFLRTFLRAATPPLGPNVILNVNYPPVERCPDPAAYRWVLARNLWNPFASDVRTCGRARLPAESDVVGREDGCYVSVTALSATTKTDVGRATQAAVIATLQSLPLSCLD